MLFIAQGLALVFASQPVTGTRIDVTIFFVTPLGPILTVQTIIVLAIAVAAAVVLGLTPVGRALFARGSNPRGVKALGLPSRSTVVGAFLASGLLASFAGVIIAIGLNSASPVVGGDLLLLGIAACLIGGSKLEGGTGSVVGTVLALLALLMLENGMDQLGVSAYVQQVTQGAVVLIALLASGSPRVGGVDLGASFRRLVSPAKGGARPDRPSRSI
jgi:ribose/xylose/arabinose/galactoside ABC-type transport system permease subunit